MQGSTKQTSRKQARKPASKYASNQASKPAGEQASAQASRQASKEASKEASKLANTLINPLRRFKGVLEASSKKVYVISKASSKRLLTKFTEFQRRLRGVQKNRLHNFENVLEAMRFAVTAL